MESRKIVQMNVFAGQEWRGRHRKWTWGRKWDELERRIDTYILSGVK